ncbi:MAG: Crp/Fnr family transcriptional regulator [Sphaerochaetaceae bacterium]|nr:Crp/Fnr family transcriptional regulator [Sphaerochaetaceae bacterium]
MLDNSDLNAMQENFPFWEDLNKEEKSTILEGTIRFTHKKGAIVHEDRNKCTGLLMVKTGQLRIYIISDTGKEITLYRLFERDVCVLSASCLIRNITFDVHIVAEKETTMLRVATDVFKTVGSVNPKVLDFTNELVSSRFSDVMWVVEQVVFMSFDKRLAMQLLELSAIEQSDTLSVTHEALARDLGTAREVVTRMLKRFQDDGIVALSRGGITITDHDALYQLT